MLAWSGMVASMTSTKRAALLWSSTNLLTRQRYEAILQVYESLDEAAKHLGEEMLKGLGCKQETIIKTLMRLEDFNVEAYENRLQQGSFQFLELNDDAYPARLKDAPDAPPFLYVKGDLSILDQPTIGLVGTRQMTKYGQRVVENFVPDLVNAGVVTVSGLAYGIDAQVAMETLKAKGKTVAVLGHGLGMIYPQANADIAKRIVENGGLIVSEFPLDLPPDTYTFPARNRIIAALSVATVVLEAPEGSGALITADEAASYGREVFAVPGQIFDPSFGGCHSLIQKNKAKLVTSAADVLRDIGIAVPEGERVTITYEPQSEDEEKVYAILTTMPIAMDDIVQKSSLPAARASAALTMMELAGAVKNAGGGAWVRA